jgi:L-ascorbate metabolism protein UlaG (beta-lactamase superfamily)
MKIHFLRHATFFLEINGIKILVDPMLSPKDAMDPVGNASNISRIPMVDLPLSEDALLEQLTSINAVIITHTHRDHWDTRAQEMIPKNTPLIIQPSDEKDIREQGFTNLLPVTITTTFKKLKINRTDGQHGSGEVGVKMGHVSGFVIEQDHKRIYIAGDTIWCTEVADALKIYKPTHVVVNAGAAQFLEGGPITMTGEDVVKVCETVPKAKVIAVHMNTVNHCLLKRKDLKELFESKNLSHQCLIPEDGDVLQF